MSTLPRARESTESTSDSQLRYVLLPGRHHALTRFQAGFVTELLNGRMCDGDGRPLIFATNACVVWVVLDADQENTQRNPLPAYRRAATIELLSRQEGIRSLIIPVAGTPRSDRCAEVLLEAVSVAEGGPIAIGPHNTVVACAKTFVACYQRLGFRTASMKLDASGQLPYPQQLLDMMAAGDDGWRQQAHPAIIDVYERYGLVDRVRQLYEDPMVGTDGSLTDSRDYESYAAAMSVDADRKWRLIGDLVRPGRIVDIGCGNGALLRRVAADARLADSVLHGVEVSRRLYQECVYRKTQGIFTNPATFFHQRNVLASGRGLFPAESVDTTLTVAVGHEVFSYGPRVAAVSRLAATVAEHTVAGGVWINYDVCGPDDPDMPVDLVFRQAGTDRPTIDLRSLDPADIRGYLDALCPADRFRQFAVNFRRNAQVEFPHSWLDDRTVRLRIADAMEFMTKYSYTDNWLAETHEQFCGLTWSTWRRIAAETGWEIASRSTKFRNEWLVDHWFSPIATLLGSNGEPIDWPDTHLLLVLYRSVASMAAHLPLPRTSRATDLRNTVAV